MTRQILVLIALLWTAPAFAQDTAAWTLTLKRDFRQTLGTARFAECHLSVSVSPGKGHASSQCAQPIEGQEMRDIAAQRELTASEVSRVIELAQASKLFAREADENVRTRPPAETLAVSCCGRADIVVLATLWNPSFDQGARRDLVELLRGWRRELTAKAEQELRDKRRQ